MLQIQCYQKMKSVTKEILLREKYRQGFMRDKQNGDDCAGKA